MPVEIEEVAVAPGLHIEAKSLLREEHDTDAYLTTDLQSIVVDAGHYMDERMQFRVRFSIAHEIGHYVLHREDIEKLDFSSPQGLISFKLLIPQSEYDWIEFHAHEFAGRLLVPHERLKEEVENALLEAETKGFRGWDESGDSLRAHVASSVHRVFGVSSDVIERRIRKERLPLRPSE